MTVRIDAERCIGCALCVDNIPEIFAMDGFLAVVTRSDPDAGLEAELQATAEDCPSEAIILDP